MNKTNCFLFALNYCFINWDAKIMCEYDDELCFFHFYVIQGNYEIHCEQKNSNDEWTWLFEYEIRKVKLRCKNRKR